jgi:hypothetical protein
MAVLRFRNLVEHLLELGERGAAVSEECLDACGVAFECKFGVALAHLLPYSHCNLRVHASKRAHHVAVESHRHDGESALERLEEGGKCM